MINQFDDILLYDGEGCPAIKPLRTCGQNISKERRTLSSDHEHILSLTKIKVFSMSRVELAGTSSGGTTVNFKKAFHKFSE